MSNELLPCPFCGAEMQADNANMATHPRGAVRLLAFTGIAVDVPARVEG